MSSSSETAKAHRAAVRDFAISVDIAAPPPVVWAVMRDVERWPEWTTTVTRIERLDSGPLTVGSRLRIRQPKLLPADWWIAARLTRRLNTEYLGIEAAGLKRRAEERARDSAMSA